MASSSIAPSVLESASGGAIAIGFAGPLSGSMARYGRQMLNAMKIETAKANSQGGALGRKIVIEAGDDKNDPHQAMLVANKLVADRVAGVIGDLTSGPAIAASSVYNRARVPMITPSASDPRLTEQGFAYVFRTGGRDDQQASFLVDYLKKLGKTKLAVINDGSPYGQRLAAAVRASLQTNGLSPAVYETASGGGASLAARLAKIRLRNPDALLLASQPTQAGLMLKQARVAGLQATVAIATSAPRQALLTAAGTAANGALIALAPDPKTIAAAQPFLKSYQAAYGTPAPYAIEAVDPTALLIQAIKRAGSRDGVRIRTAIANTSNFTGIYRGGISFDAKGNLKNPAYAMWTVKNGAFQQLGGASSG